MSDVFVKVIGIMVVFAVILTVFGATSSYDFFASFADSVGVLSGVADKVSGVLFALFPSGNDKLDSLEEFYLLRYWFGENNEYYVDLALPDLNNRQKGRDDYYYLSSNYPAEEVYIVEIDVVHELIACSKNPDGRLFEYWGLKRYTVYFMTKEEYYSDYCGDPTKCLPS